MDIIINTSNVSIDNINPSMMMVMNDDDEDDAYLTTGSTRSSINPAVPSTITNNNTMMIKATIDSHDDAERRKHTARFFDKHAKWSLIGEGRRWVRGPVAGGGPAAADDHDDDGIDKNNNAFMDIQRHHHEFKRSSKMEDNTTKTTSNNMSSSGSGNNNNIPPTRRRAILLHDDNNDEQCYLTDSSYKGSHNEKDVSSAKLEIVSDNVSKLVHNPKKNSTVGRRHHHRRSTARVVVNDYNNNNDDAYETPLPVAPHITLMSSPKEVLKWWTSDFDACPPYLGEENHPLHDMQYSPFSENDRQWKKILRKAPKFNSSSDLRHGSRSRRRSSVASRRSSISSAGGSLSDCEVANTFECVHLDEVMDSLCSQSDPEYDHVRSSRSMATRRISTVGDRQLMGRKSLHMRQQQQQQRRRSSIVSSSSRSSIR